MTVGTKHTNGSNYAFEYLTASVLVDGERLVLAVRSLKSKKNIPSCIANIIRRLREELKLKIRLAILDGGFFSTAVMRLLEQSGLRYLVRMPPTYKTKRMKLWHGRRFTYRTSGHHRKKSEQISKSWLYTMKMTTCGYSRRIFQATINQKPSLSSSGHDGESKQVIV
ncbi:MAG: transposase [Nitrososphaerota archaeon]|nr:transposase [Nitrososphaerota archaeon]